MLVQVVFLTHTTGDLGPGSHDRLRYDTDTKYLSPNLPTWFTVQEVPREVEEGEQTSA